MKRMFYTLLALLAISQPALADTNTDRQNTRSLSDLAAYFSVCPSPASDDFAMRLAETKQIANRIAMNSSETTFLADYFLSGMVRETATYIGEPRYCPAMLRLKLDKLALLKRLP